MVLNPRMKISFEVESSQEEWLEVMKQKLKDRLKIARWDSLFLEEDNERQWTVYFSPDRYKSIKEFVEGFEKAAGLSPSD